MKEDSTLICPISYDDPDGHWAKLEAMLLERLPLRDVTWKSPISSSYITINRLPLRFLPSDAGLFKDTDHPYRWFLSQYAGIYLLVAETLDSYKTQRQKVRKWIDTQNVPKGSLGKTYWILVYVTLGNYPVASYQKVFTRISGDFYADRSGDRTVMIHLPPDGVISQQAANNGSSMHSISAFSAMNRGDNGLSDFMAKIREGIVLAFPHRSLLYDGEIRRLDLGRSTPQQYDFKQLFLVKESFALFYQMMQLLDMALGQYEELELMMSFAPTSTLPETQWPYRPPESLKPPESNNTNNTSNNATIPTPTTPVDTKDIMSDVVKNGEDVVSYSMNVARMKVLKSKMSLHELYRYVFARQMFYLVSLQRPVECVIKAKLFLENISSILLKEIDKNYAEVSIERTTKTIMLSVWCLTASIKCMRVCRDLVDRIISIDGNGTGNGVTGLESSQSISSIMNVMKLSSYQQSSSYSNNFESSEIKELDTQQILPERMSIATKEKLTGFKEVFAMLSDLLDFACIHYRRITPISRFARRAGYHLMQQGEEVNNSQAAGYFSIFQSREISDRLTKEWNNFSLNISGNVGIALSSIAQRIRSASRYWAKLLMASNDNRNLVKLEPSFIEDTAYLEVLASCQLQSQQYEKGRILEVSLVALLHHTTADLHALSDRKQSLITARLRQVEIFAACSFYPAAITRLQELLCIDSDPLWYQRVDRNLCSWPSLSSLALKWLLHAAQQTKMTSLIKETLAALYIRSTCDNDVESRQVYFQKLFVKNESDDKKWLVLPTVANLSFSVGTIRYQPHHSHRIAHDRVINLLEEPFGVSWLEIISQPEPIPLKVTIDSTLPQVLPVSNIMVVFKRIPSDGLEVLFGMHPADLMLEETTSSTAAPASYPPRHSSTALMSNNPLALTDDEFACELPSDCTLSIHQGKQTVELQLITTVLGDFILQRILLVCQEPMIIFACRALDNITNTAYENNSDIIVNELSNPMLDCIEVQAYFDHHPLLRILPPSEILSIDMYSGMRVPPNQFDQLIISLHINDGDCLQRLKLSIVCDSRCRRISDENDGQVGLILTCLPVVSYFRGGDGSSRANGSTIRNNNKITGSFDANTMTPHFVEREFAVKIASAEQWDFIWSGCEEQPACSINNKTAIEVYQVNGGSGIQLRIPYYIATKLLDTTEIDEFTLQTQLQISAEGIIQKGPCAVPFSTTGSPSLFCCNLLQAHVASSQCLSGIKHYLQFTLLNITIVELVVNAFALLDSAGQVILQSLEELQHVGYPEDLLYSFSTDELETLHSDKAPHLLPSEEYSGFLSLPINANNVHAMRIYYRRQSDRSDLHTLLSTDLQLNLSSVTTKPSLPSIAAPAGSMLEEARYQTLTKDSFHTGQMLWLKSRLQFHEQGSWSLFIDSVITLPPAEYNRSALLCSSCLLQAALMSEVKAWFVDTSTWLFSGMLCTVADNDAHVYNIEFALVPTVSGIVEVPPLKLLFGDQRDEVLLFPHRNSSAHMLLIGAGDEPHTILFYSDSLIL